LRWTALRRDEVDCFAIHEPNPRFVELLALRAKIPLEKIPLVSRTCGNLGSVTCGASLCTALGRIKANSPAPRLPLIFLAAVGPGLIWGGTYLH
jgi:3-oxoacyl-[acyl-carrier-protein] synthase III